MVERHDILRTTFISQHIAKPVQVVFKNKKFKLNFIDLSKTDKSYSDIINEFQAKDKQKGYKLDTDSLFRISIVKLSDDKASIILSFHHIIMVGWWIGLIMTEILNLYSLIKENKNTVLQDPVKFNK